MEDQGKIVKTEYLTMTRNNMKKTLLEEKRERYLRSLINETIINVLAEQDEMQAALPATTPSPSLVEPSVPDATGTEDMPEQEELFTVDEMIKELNVLRGGKSLKDPEVYGQMTTFFNNLTDEQKTSIHWLLGELTKIVAATSDPAQNTAPELNSNSSQPTNVVPPAIPPAAPVTAPAPTRPAPVVPTM